MPKQKYELLEGTYTEPGFPGKTYARARGGAPVYVTSEIALDKEFDNKFRRVVVEAAPVPEQPEELTREDVEALKQTAETTKTTMPGTEPVPKGDDVTAKFPLAADNDLKVFMDDDKFFVYDGGKLLKGDVTSALQIRNWIKSHVSG